MSAVAGVFVEVASLAQGLSDSQARARNLDTSHVAGAAGPSVHYVDTRGSDSAGDGSRSRPWRSLAKACAATPGGDGRTIRVSAGNYTESATCDLACSTNLRGAGRAKTVVTGSADPLIRLRNCMQPGNQQTISGFHLDGQGRTAGVFGLRALRTRGLTISGMIAEGFKGPRNAGGGAMDIRRAWDLDLGNSILRNSGRSASRACSGTLGVGEIYDSAIHDLEITEDEGYGIKASMSPGSESSNLSNVDFFNLRVRALSDTCARWNTLAVELWQTDALATTIRNSSFNRSVSLTDFENAPPLSHGYRYRLHHNIFLMRSREDYAIELDQNSSIVDHNYISRGLYPIANFASQRKRGITIHHNVFDNQTGPTAGLHMTAGVLNAKFYNNTVVLRQRTFREGIFSLSEFGFSGSTIEIKNNLFTNPHYSIGDKLGTGLDLATVDHNGFHNVLAKGTASVVGNPLLPLDGGFPRSYMPAAGSPAIDAGLKIPGITTGFTGVAPDLGAFDHGTAPWSIGPRQ